MTNSTASTPLSVLYGIIITDSSSKHSFYQPYGSWPQLISTWKWVKKKREKRMKHSRKSGWAGVLFLLSFLSRTWQYDNILSTILSDIRLWSSPIINPGWAPAQVVQKRRPTDCQHVWQIPPIPQPWRWSCTGDTLTLHTRRTQQSFSQQTHLWNSLLDHC